MNFSEPTSVLTLFDAVHRCKTAEDFFCGNEIIKQFRKKFQFEGSTIELNRCER